MTITYKIESKKLEKARMLLVQANANIQCALEDTNLPLTAIQRDELKTANLHLKLNRKRIMIVADNIRGMA